MLIEIDTVTVITLKAPVTCAQLNEHLQLFNKPDALRFKQMHDGSFYVTIPPTTQLQNSVFLLDAISDLHAQFKLGGVTDEGIVYVNKCPVHDFPALIKLADDLYATSYPETFTQWAYAAKTGFAKVDLQESLSGALPKCGARYYVSLQVPETL